jgi:hypothetical protein
MTYMSLGGIAGNSSMSVSICMALVSEIDGGAATAGTKYCYAIGGDLYYLSGNYALEFSPTEVDGKIWIHGDSHVPDPGLTNKDGYSTPLDDFEIQTTYTTAGWNFTSGTEDWKFLPAGSGYDYPVLSWQNSPPADPAELMVLPQ